MSKRRRIIVLMLIGLSLSIVVIIAPTGGAENHGLRLTRTEKTNSGGYARFVLHNNSTRDFYYVLAPRLQVKAGADWGDYVAADEVGMIKDDLVLKLGVGQKTEMWARVTSIGRDSSWRAGATIIHTESPGAVLKFIRWLRSLSGQSQLRKFVVWSNPQINIENTTTEEMSADLEE